jgi:hypothetical protein
MDQGLNRMFIGIDNKNLGRKDRISLLSQTQIMSGNGHSMGEIKKFAASFSEPRELEFPKVGRDFARLMVSLGHISK